MSSRQLFDTLNSGQRRVTIENNGADPQQASHGPTPPADGTVCITILFMAGMLGSFGPRGKVQRGLPRRCNDVCNPRRNHGLATPLHSIHGMMTRSRPRKRSSVRKNSPSRETPS